TVAINEQILRSKQTDSLGSAALDLCGSPSLLDIGREKNPMTIKGDCRFEQNILQFMLQALLMGDELAIFEQSLVSRINDDIAVESIQQRVLAGLQLSAEIFQTDHGGNSQGPRHDRRMRGFAADVRCEPKYETPIQLRCVRRG